MTTPTDSSALLQQAAAEQNQYDLHAGYWQVFHFRTRLAVLILGIFTALFGVLYRTGYASDAFGPVWPILLFGLPGLTVVLMLLIYVVNPGQRWVAYRAGAESLKTEAFLYATGSEKYRAAPEEHRGPLFQQRLASIQTLVANLQPKSLGVRLATAWKNWTSPPPPPTGGVNPPITPATSLDPETYVKDRLLPQRDWYDRRGRQHRSTQGLLGTGMVLFNVLAGVLVAIGHAEWIPVATTIVGALATYSALSNSEFLANSYRQTVLQLDRLLAAWQRGDYSGTPNGFAQFVLHVEQVIAREYTGWVQLQPNEATS